MCIRLRDFIPSSIEYTSPLDHFPQQRVDHVSSAAKITAIDKVNGLLPPSTVGCVQLEMPEELIGLLEVRSTCVQLMYQILHTDDVVFTCNKDTQLGQQE